MKNQTLDIDADNLIWIKVWLKKGYTVYIHGKYYLQASLYSGLRPRFIIKPKTAPAFRDK